MMTSGSKGARCCAAATPSGRDDIYSSRSSSTMTCEHTHAWHWRWPFSRGAAGRSGSVSRQKRAAGMPAPRCQPAASSLAWSGTPICGAARPTPGAARIVSSIVWTSSRSSWLPSFSAGTAAAGCGGGREGSTRVALLCTRWQPATWAAGGGAAEAGVAACIVPRTLLLCRQSRRELGVGVEQRQRCETAAAAAGRASP